MQRKNNMIHPAIILDHPQMGENIGAAARAMHNFGLSDLRIVAPRDGWPNQAAIQNAAGALDKFSPTVFETLPEALTDLHYVLATTARPRDMVKPVFTPEAAVTESRTRHTEGQKIGFLFGRERTGLENADLSHCHGIITIPTNPDFSSLNLGQSVLLMGYEWLKAEDQTPARDMSPGDSFPVTQDKLDEFLNRLIQELDNGAFFRAEGLRPTTERNIRNMFTRSDLTDQEVRTLQGMISALIRQKKPLE